MESNMVRINNQDSHSVPEMMEYSVRGSDTLASIALKFNTTTSKLARMNRLSSRLLFPGQTLFVPVKISLIDKEKEKQREENDLELVARPPSSHPFPTRQTSLSPDHQMEELLRKDDSGQDEISEKYLRINGRYITDGQGVVPGVLLVTPQTVMFNPSVYDHLVIERGRDAYTVKTPIKAVQKIVYYHDIAALVLGDTTGEFLPELPCKDQKGCCEEGNITMDTSNYVSQDTADILSESGASNLCEGDDTVQPSLRNDMDKSDSGEKNKDYFQDTSGEISQDETVTESCGCIRTSTDESTNYPDSTISTTMNEQSNTTADLRGTFTNHDRDVGKGSDIAERTSDDAESMRGIDINDSKCTSTPRKFKDNTYTNTNTHSNAKVNTKDDGLIYTKIQARNTIKSLTGNAIQLEEGKRDSDGHFRSTKEPLLSYHDGDSFSQVDSSRDSGISDGSSFQSNSSRSRSSFSGESSEKNGPRSPRASSLSMEARQWLGERGIRISTDSEDEGNYTASFDASKKKSAPPKPPALTADELVYICIRVHKSYWCRSAALQTHIMGVPHNRDQQRMEHWFAVPQTRISQLHAFFTTWNSVKEVNPNCGDGISRSIDGISIIDDTFSKPSSEELFLDRFEQAKRYKEPYKEGYMRTSPVVGARKSTISSLNEDDAPELTDESSILEKVQLIALSRELPSRTVGHKWNLVYSTAIHGISLKTLYRNTQNIDTPVLLVIVDQEGQTFGAFLSDSPKVSEGYYGTGESMLFTFVDKKVVKAYHWTGTNSFFIKGDSLCLSVGGGDGLFGLWLDGDLNHGRSHSCKTFDNETLSSKEDFICRGLEAWSFE